MNKRLSLYQIFMVAMTTIIAAMLVAMGVIAIQKSMRLKLAFQINPAIEIMLEMAEIDEEGEVGEFRSIFKNSDTPFIENGITLSGNTLSFGNAYAEGLGANFALKITNLTESMVLAEFSGASYDKAYLIFEPSGSEAQQVKVSAVSALTIDFTQIVAVSITDNSNGGLTLSTTDESDLIKVNGSYLQNNGVYYAELGKEISLYYELGSSYKNNSISASVDGKQVASGATSITISASNATSNITITLQAELSGFEITLNYNDGVTSSKTISGAYTQLPSTLEVPTRAGYTFAGWYSDEIAETDLPSDQILYYSYSYLEDVPVLTQNTTKTLVEDITLHARWLPYTIKTYGADFTPPEAGYSGYKYIEFANTTTWTNGAGDTVPLRWVIIGAGANQKALLPDGAANKDTNLEELGANEILVLSEQGVEWFYTYNYYNMMLVIQSYTEEGGFMANFTEYMVSQELITAECDGNDDYFLNNSVYTTDKMLFLLAYGSTGHSTDGKTIYASQNFKAENYLGVLGHDLYKTSYAGDLTYSSTYTVNTWVTRSSYCKYHSSWSDETLAFYMDGRAEVTGGGYSCIRPCFVLNLA